ncbi:MAG: flagellar biosynthesis protein FlhA, partial [Thermanaerothrix sp.]|nr:flagellar biosynthesis protein FlhA [Thermanaerothrix sp.]
MTTDTRPLPALKLSNLLGSSDYALAVGVIIIVLLLLLPLPPVIVDILLAANLALSVGILLLTLYISQPMDFSVFPTLLLLVTLFRLGINIAISRLILVQGNAGKMVETFGNLILGNNYVVGVVIFLMLMIIQFVVINNGTGRVAEVAARFTLDAMPGKQLAIDADLNAGLIDEEEARRRRRLIELEADFYGSMDGASKFVKGDSIAALIIMVVNLLGGFAIGVLQRGLPLMDALQSYALLTIGAGLAIQVPALLISAASGLVVTRNASERSLGHEILGQFSNLNTLVAGAAIMGLMALIPGFPKLPFLFLAALLGGAAYWVHQKQQKAAVTVLEETTATKTEAESPTDMLEVVVVDPVELEIGYGLIPLIDEAAPDNLLRRITTLRRQLATELGLILPIVRIRDNLRLPPQAYRVKIRGQEVARGELLLDHMLAIPTSASNENLKGIPTTEPAFGLPAVWIKEAESGRAELMGYT